MIHANQAAVQVESTAAVITVERRRKRSQVAVLPMRLTSSPDLSVDLLLLSERAQNLCLESEELLAGLRSVVSESSDTK